MTIKRFRMEKLMKKTCELNGASYGLACNKTVFLLQRNMQSSDKSKKTWTAMYYENDRFGLLNGIIYLINESEEDEIEIFLSESKINDICILRINKAMSFSDISAIIDNFYYTPKLVVQY